MWRFSGGPRSHEVAETLLQVSRRSSLATVPLHSFSPPTQISLAFCFVFVLSNLSDDACTSGQLVIASRESQYKILHFHHAGLDKLLEVFQQWRCCRETQLKDQVRSVGSRTVARFLLVLG